MIQNDGSCKFFKTDNGKFVQKIGSAKSYEEGRAFDLAMCICLEQTVRLSFPSIFVCGNHTLTSISKDEVTEKFGKMCIPSITIEDLYYQMMDHVYLSRPNNKKIIFEKTATCGCK